MSIHALQDDPPGPLMPTTKPEPDRHWIQVTLFILALLSATRYGMRYMFNFQEGRFPISSERDVIPFPWIFSNLPHFALGLPFSVTLLAILLTHEFGHYFACRRYGIKASVPYLLPAPSLGGTAGAIIRLKSSVNSRAALICIGAIGPIAGFLVATIATIIGLTLSKPVVIEPHKLVDFQSPLIFKILAHLLHVSLDRPLLWHPILIASWLGILLTSLNLLPAGQLDGGHILYALSPRIHRIATYAAIVGLVYLGIEHWAGWLAWAAFLCLPGMSHPTVNDTRPLPPRLLALVPLALIVLFLAAMPQPFTKFSALDLIAKIHH
jgi:membrane-associated protease RseP (regulator of RpoE activity)